MSASTAFEAQYAGECMRCRDGIEIGDTVRYVEDELMHFRHDVIERPVVTCEKCWLTKPCDCEERGVA